MPNSFKQKTWYEWLCAAGSVFFGFVLFSPETFAAYPWIKELADYVAFGGTAAIGFGGVDIVRRRRP